MLVPVTEGQPCQVLAMGSGASALEGVLALLDPARFAVHRSSDPTVGLQLAAAEPWDLVLIAYPPRGFELDEIAMVVRAPSSPSRRSGLIAVAEPDGVDEASLFLGRGINRVVSLDLPVEYIVHCIDELTSAAPRVLVRAVLELQAELSRRPTRALFQTENVSATGMLVRGGRVFPLGTTFDFDLAMPSGAPPVRGAARVVRHTDPFREHLEGFAAQFVRFEGDGREHLDNWLSHRLS